MDNSLDTASATLAGMDAMGSATSPGLARVSPLQLADHLITLAQEAEQAGFAGAAQDLVALVYAVLDRQTATQH